MAPKFASFSIYKTESESEKDPISSKLGNIENIAKLSWVLERRNIFNIDKDEYSIASRDAFHIISKEKIQRSFIDCHMIGSSALNNLVSKMIHYKPLGSIEHLRKQLGLKKIVPFPVKKIQQTKNKGPTF